MDDTLHFYFFWIYNSICVRSSVVQYNADSNVTAGFFLALFGVEEESEVGEESTMAGLQSECFRTSNGRNNAVDEFVMQNRDLHHRMRTADCVESKEAGGAHFLGLSGI